MVLATGWLKMRVLESAPKGLRPLTNAFWTAKAHTKKQFDAIVVGDSRVYRGISPEAMEPVLGGMSVFNFGYSSAGMSSVLLEASEERLNPNGKRVIIIGLTPYSLTPSAALNEQYKEFEKAMNWPNQFPLLKAFLSPEETLWVIKYLMGVEIEKYYQIPHEDGWVESYKPSAKSDDALDEYKQRFSKDQVSKELFNYFIEHVRKWRTQGYTVFAFRPPASEKMEILEDSHSGYDEPGMKQEFMEAGGIWIDIPDRYSYTTYDGSHLTGESALLLSKYIANFISNKINIPVKMVKIQ
jgi:hypothetical protein